MPIIACPHCRTALEAPDSVLGRQVTCGQCGRQFLAAAMPPPGPGEPGPSASASEPLGASPPPAAPPSPPPAAPPQPAPQAAPPQPAPQAATPPPVTAWPYGAPGPIPPSYGGYSKTPGIATAALVLGIVSLPACCCWPAGLVCAILAIVFGGMASRDIAAGLIEPAADGKAKTGRICGIIGLVLAILMGVIGIVNLAVNGLPRNPRFGF